MAATRKKNATRKTAVGPGPKRRAAAARAKLAKRTAAARPTDPAVPAPVPTLSGKATRYLRSLGHHLEPVVQIGKEGLTDGVVDATRAALLAHELVKVKVSQDAPLDRKVAGQELADRAGAMLAQTLGRTVLLYKRHPHKPKIVLPR
jgi:RNA-binding protein